jgi:hypothetical protein
MSIIQAIVSSPARLRIWWFDLYKQYEFWGVFLISISLLAIVAGIIISYSFYNALTPFLRIAEPGDELDMNATGMIGDFIGGVVGPILSFVGVLLFFLALRLQSKELGLQIKELADTRSVFIRQQFESTFFNLLQTQQDIRQKFEADVAETIHGKETLFESIRSSMHGMHSHIRHHLNAIEKIYDRTDIDVEKKDYYSVTDKLTLQKYIEHDDYTVLYKPMNLIRVIYGKVDNSHGDKLGHYFRNLYHILSYINDNERFEVQQAIRDRTIDNKIVNIGFEEVVDSEFLEELEIIEYRHNKYAAFVQAQMSSVELFQLFYNALFYPKMKALIHRYDFLENLNADDLLDKERDLKFYEECDIDGKKCRPVNLKTRDALFELE